jgi:methanogenesis imperfect marker protein 11
MKFDDTLEHEFKTEIIVDDQHNRIERAISVPKEVTGMLNGYKFLMSTQTLIGKGGRIEGNRLIYPLKQGVFKGPPIPSIRFLILREVDIQGDTVKLVEDGIGGGKSALRLWTATADHVEVEKTHLGKTEVHTYTSYYPILNRVVIGIDDTDTSTKGDTYLTALHIGRSIESEGYGSFIKQTVTINYPRNPFKTTNNASSAMVFHVKPSMKTELINAVIEKVQETSNSRDTGVAIFNHIDIPQQLQYYTRQCKSRMMEVSDTEYVAKTIGAQLLSFDQDRGKIGALSSIGYVNEPYKAISPSLKYQLLMKLGNTYVKVKDTFAQK